MISTQPFNAEHPYQLSEDNYSTLQVVEHTLAVLTDLTDGKPGSTVTLSRESLAGLTGHLAALLKQV